VGELIEKSDQKENYKRETELRTLQKSGGGKKSWGLIITSLFPP
jgi:hypothetical protein